MISELIEGLADRKRAELAGEITRLEDELRHAERRIVDQIAPLRARLNEIIDLQRQVKPARRELAETCPYEDRLAVLKDVRARLAQARGELAVLREQADRAKLAESDRQAASISEGITAGHGEVNESRAMWLSRAERHERAAKAAIAKLPEFEKLVIELEREEAAALEATIEP